MPLFGGIAQVRGFHPDAKKIVADAMLHEADVTILSGFLVDVITQQGTVRDGLISTPTGMLSLSATAWIDATGDGDLAALAGASFELGRTNDGQLHAFSQSSGRTSLEKGVTKMHSINFDAGYVDPTDSQDLTRARLLGISHYEQPRYTQNDRPTYIAPAIGIRQGRQIHTDYVLTLADLIERRRFDDCVGYTGCHYENHAVDYEMESDEPMFWVWVCRQWFARTACEIPYRCLIPKQITNVWLACRALGVTVEAHSSLRMQRDIQRVGEVAGIAATLAVKHDTDSRKIDFKTLVTKLRASGAVKMSECQGDHFGPAAHAGRFTPTVNVTDCELLRQWASALSENTDPRSEMWWLYRAGPSEAGALIKPLLQSTRRDTSWFAATIMAMWGDAQAQLRLCRAIREHEYGFESAPQDQRPEFDGVLVPRWMAAVALLRVCGNGDCLETLHNLAMERDLVLNVRTSIAITCQRMSKRCEWNLQQREMIRSILDQLLESRPPLEKAEPRRVVVKTELAPAPAGPDWSPVVLEDFSWQMHLEIARARMAIGDSPHQQAQQLLSDDRAIVRHAAQRVLVCDELAVSSV